MAQKPVMDIKLLVQSTITGHTSKGVWVAQAIAGGELCVFRQTIMSFSIKTPITIMAIKQDDVQTIEQTSKWLKKQLLFAALTAIAGIIFVILGLTLNSSSLDALDIIGIALTFAGLAWLSIIKIKIWWYHK